MLHFRSFNEGFPIVLLHGFGETSAIWENQIQYFKSPYRLIIIDLPGGNNAPMVDDVSFDAICDLLKNTLDKEKIKECILIGHSMGGYITMAFVNKYPQYIKAFGLFHSTSYSDSDEKKENRKKGIAFIKQHGAMAFLQSVDANLFCNFTKENNPALINKYIDDAKNYTDDVLIKYYHAMMQRPDNSAVLKNTNKPFLLIAGEEDISVPLPDSLAQSHLANITCFHLLKRSGHMGMLEEPALCNSVLEDFFKLVMEGK